MQAVNQLSQPSGNFRSNAGYRPAKTVQPAKPGFARYRYVTAVVVYLVLAMGLISASLLDNSYLLRETISVFVIIGLCLTVRLLGKEVDGQLPEPKSKKQ